MSRVRVYIACSLDGFIAGPDDDLAWLDDYSEAIQEDPGDGIGFGDFMAEVGALLMGRRTYDVVEGFDGDWPYGETPVVVATTRALDPVAPTVQAVSGSIEQVVARAKEVAGDGDVYLDGGGMIRQALDAGLVDELIVSQAPTVLGKGIPLFAGVEREHRFRVEQVLRIGPMVQLVMRPSPG